MKPLPVALLDALARRMLGGEAYDPMFLPRPKPPVCECGHPQDDHAAASKECMATTRLRAMVASCPCYGYVPARAPDPGAVTARHGRPRLGAPWPARALGWAALGLGAARDAGKRLRAAWARLRGRS